MATPDTKLSVLAVGEEAVVIPRPPKKPKMIVLVGLSGSGKSTLAYEWALQRPKTIRVNRDNIRIMLHGREWYPKREREVTMAEDVLVRGYLTVWEATAAPIFTRNRDWFEPIVPQHHKVHAATA